MTAPATRIRGFGPTARTLILCALGLLCGLAMLLAAFVGLRDGQRTADLLATRTLPATLALRDLSVASTQAQENFLTAVHRTDPDIRTVALAAAGRRPSAGPRMAHVPRRWGRER